MTEGNLTPEESLQQFRYVEPKEEEKSSLTAEEQALIDEKAKAESEAQALAEAEAKKQAEAEEENAKKALEEENKETQEEEKVDLGEESFEQLLEKEAIEKEKEDKLRLLAEIEENGTLDFYKKAKAENKSLIQKALEHKTIDIDSLTEEQKFTAKFKKLGWDDEKIKEQYAIFEQKEDYEKAPLLREVEEDMKKFNEEQLALAKKPLAQSSENNEKITQGLQELTSTLKEMVGKKEGGVLHTNPVVHAIYKEASANPYFKSDGSIDVAKTIKHARIEVAEGIIAANAKSEGRQEGLKEAFKAKAIPAKDSPKGSIAKEQETLDTQSKELFSKIAKRNDNPYA